MSIDLISELILQYRYWILVPLAIFEGPIIAFLVGTFVALGYFNIFLAFLILFLGDNIPDVIYYLFGRYGEQKKLIRRYAAKIGVDEEHFDTIRRLWGKHPAKMMLFTKVAYGLSTPLLVSAGIVGMPLRLFVRYAILLGVVQYGTLFALGYYFSSSLRFVSDTVKMIQMAVGGFIVVVAAYYLFARYMRKKLMKAEAKEKSAGEIEEKHP